MGQGTPGSYGRSGDHWITLVTDGWRDGDVMWAREGPGRRDALDGPFLWLLISDSADSTARAQLGLVAERVQQSGAAVHAQMLEPSREEVQEAVANLVAAAASASRQVSVLFRGDVLRLEARWDSVTLGEAVEALSPELGHCRLVIASCSAGNWAFGGRRPWGPHGATLATSRHVEVFCASQPVQCGFTCTVPELYIRWLLGDDGALETLARVSQTPMSAVLALESRAAT